MYKAIAFFLLLLIGANASSLDAGKNSAAGQQTDTSSYRKLLTKIQASRDSIEGQYENSDETHKKEILHSTGEFLVESLYKKIIPYWIGTKWEFYGQTKIPGDSSIACGRFVVITLSQLGIKMEDPDQMAENYSAYMVNSLCDTSFKFSKAEELLDVVKKYPDDVWVVGLRNHSGLLVKYKGQIRFVHSSYMTPTAVVDEPAEESLTFLYSNIYVAGPLFVTNSLTRKWILKEEVKYRKKY
ncbi:MAG: hypothetical protein ACJ75J_03360 [Cytophagaceae bacterium]